MLMGSEFFFLIPVTLWLMWFGYMTYSVVKAVNMQIEHIFETVRSANLPTRLE